MYCSNCGLKVAGNFCSGCGFRLAAPEQPPSLVGNWEQEVHYAVLLQYTEVRDLLSRHAAGATKPISGEKFLELCDVLFDPLTGVSLEKVASIAAPIYGRLGIRTGKTHTQLLPRPIGRVLVATLCSLALHSRTIKQVHQAEDGCVIEAVLPSDIWSFEGELVVSVQQRGTSTQVDAATKIPGQLFDWGKSTQALQQLFAELARFATDPTVPGSIRRAG